MRLIAILPLLMLILSISIIALLIYALITLVKANQSQAESLREIELTLKRMSDRYK